MAHLELHLSVTVRALCATARPSHWGVCQCCCLFPRCRDQREDSSEEGGHMHITHPEYACLESVPSELAFVAVDVFESKALGISSFSVS